MRNLMNDLLDLAQIENSTFKLNKAFFSLPEAIQQAFNMMAHHAQKKNVEIEGPIIKPDEL